MNNIRKTFAGFLVFGMLATFAFGQKGATTVSAQSQDFSSTARNLSVDDFSDEVEVSYDELGVSITQSTITSTSQSLTVSFRSKTLSGFKTAIGNYYVGIDDPNYTGDASEPAAEGYDVFDEESGLPLFEGYVAYIVGSQSSENNKNIYLPTKLTYAGHLAIRITYIAAGAVTATGYHEGTIDIDSAWTFESGGETFNRITNIYIPNTINKVESGAFTGMPTDGSVVIHYEGNSLPASVFEDGWVDADTSDTNLFDVSADSYDKKNNKNAKYGGSVNLPDPLGRPLNFVLGYIDEDTNKKYPLTIQYDLVTTTDGSTTRETKIEELELVNTSHSHYDACGNIANLSYTRTMGYKLGPGQSIDDSSIIFHNILKADDSGDTTVIDFDHRYFAKPLIAYSEKQTIDNIVHVRASTNSSFMGYSLFKLKMDKNLSIVSIRYPQPHSLYLDVKTDMYEQNKDAIKSGKTKIRYSLYNLYNSFYHFQYIGSNGALKDITVPIKSTISYQVLENNSDNLVSVLVKNSDIAPDFKPEKVRLFELQNITIMMDLITINDSGSVSNLGSKSAISYKFAYITIIDTKSDISVFNWDLFMILFFVGYIALFAIAAFVTYKIMKEKFKNDEFRRVNGKKFTKQAILSGLGLGEVLLAVLFLIMRTSGFRNTIVVFNPTDPFLIATAIVALIIIGYFIVYLVKLIKAEKERRKAIRLKLNEDVEDDGTN